MRTAQEKLVHDLHILEAMAAEMDTYLAQETLFWRMMQPGTPMLTLGGYLMRQHRLLALHPFLGEGEQERLNTAVAQFDAALVEKVVRCEQKAHTEIDARLRQWREYLNEAEWERNPLHNAYPTAVEARVMLAVLVDKLQESPYQLQATVVPRIAQLDILLRGRWKAGDFIWFPEWAAAYPPDRYWWLYGRPQ